MSDSGFLEKLLDGAAVEWVPLGGQDFFEVANRGRKPVKASRRAPGDTPYYGANNVQDFVDGHTHHGEYVLIAEDGSASVEKYSIQYATGKFWANNHVHVIRGKQSVNTRYLFHYLCIVNYIPFLTGGGRAKLTKGKMIEISVPIPCPEDPKKSLAIQAEIVRILDAFTELTTELTTELNLRKKQYNHYRTQLLDFKPFSRGGEFLQQLLDGDSVSWNPLGEKAEYSKTRIGFDQLDMMNYVGVDNLLQNRGGRVDSSHVPTSGNLIEYRAGDVLIGNIRPYLRKVWLSDRPGGTNGDVLVVRPTDNTLNSRYLYQILAGEKFFEYNIKHSKGAKMPRGSKPQILQYPIPVPCPNDPKKSLAIQAEIIRILDKFDTLTTSLNEGLPREIKMRKQQYEYYRDLLLSFPKPEEDV